ncbi:alpha/beta hydrolase [Alteromonas sp. 009811495]|uniref:alpha/beta hydrolase n=1 Tax=Alteromonas sp. 009811495 TaxID=3002962 RepID=UPI00237E4AFC|nr:alpha/beta hydrolase [Alteromonas sp. 009811495]WDT87742.1 alpha/beta hydrolase [Alteromonas sp. 009811495]
MDKTKVSLRLLLALFIFTSTSLPASEGESAVSVSDQNQDPNQVQTQTPAPMRTQVGYGELLSLETRPSDSTITYGEDPLQRVEVWRATAPANAALVFIHGGCWLNTYDLNHAKGFYHALAEKGITTYAVEYRRTGDEGGGWPGSLHDVSAGITASLDDVARNNSKQTVVLAGHSAGGHLALLAAQSLGADFPGTMSPGAIKSGHVNNTNVQIQSVLGLAAITDVAKYAMGTNSCQSATTAFMGGEPSTAESAYTAATPDSSKSDIPFHLLHGSSDSIVPVHHASLTGAASTIVPSGGHFDWLHPESTSFHALLEVISQHGY